MADYWKSHAKKFCDFCKCWIADNKPSIGFHEAGKRHKENVSKRLSEISKDSAKSYKEGLQIDHDMKKMEKEALKAYMKDLKENPDYTSMKILEEAENKKRELEEAVRQKKEEKEIQPAIIEEETPQEIKTNIVWYEAKSDEGYTYYWNVNNAESKWEPPEEGFVSIEDQEKEAKLKEEEKKRKKEEKAKRKAELKMAKESANKKRKQLDDVKDEEPGVSVGPAPKPDPYGPWTRVEPIVEEPIDWQLPVQNKFVAVKVPEDALPEIKFKEKTVSSIKEDTTLLNSIKKEAEESSTMFKKRKFNKGNARQKLDTD